MKRITYATVFLALLGTAANGADVYRSTAPDGSVSYSDRPQGADSQFVLATQGAPRAQGAAPAPTPAAGNAGTPAAQPAPPQAAADPAALPEGPSANALREQRTKNCGIARERQERYSLSRRLFRTNAAGVREYLDDAAVAEARSKAAADVQDWCD